MHARVGATSAHNTVGSFAAAEALQSRPNDALDSQCLGLLLPPVELRAQVLNHSPETLAHSRTHAGSFDANFLSGNRVSQLLKTIAARDNSQASNVDKERCRQLDRPVPEFHSHVSKRAMSDSEPESAYAALLGTLNGQRGAHCRFRILHG